MLPRVLLLGVTSLLASGASSKAHPGKQQGFRERNLNTVQSIYNLTLYPNNIPFLTNGTVPAGLFNPDATGRISPLGNFTGYQDSAEYFFGLSLVPTEANDFQAFFSAEIISFTSECPEVATSIVYLNITTVDPATGEVVAGGNFTALKQIAMWRFDESGAVLEYEAWIPNLAAFVAPTVTGETPPPVLIAGLCPVIQDTCVGPYQQYDSVPDCVATLTGKQFGLWDEAWGDNVVCRSLHLMLARLRPEVHCPHVGKVGGNMEHGFKCVNIRYDVDYFDDQVLFRGNGHPFFCKARNQYLHIKRDVEGPRASE